MLASRLPDCQGGYFSADVGYPWRRLPPGPPMSDPRPEAPPSHDALRASLEAWLNQRHQSLLEEVMAAWQEGLTRFRPDADLLARLSEAAPSTLVLGNAESSERHLAAALDLIEGATSQSELLKRLLDGLAPFVERSALFILKQGLASLYAQRGFDGEPPRRAGAVVPSPDLEALIHGGLRAIRRSGPAYSALLAPLSSFAAPDLAILPLRHKRKAVALLLVDSGARQKLDRPEQVRALVLAASALLAALAAGREDEHTAAPAEPMPSAPTQMVPEPIEAPTAQELDPRTRAGAERLARVLVGDVELYFPAKVAQARTQGNLYGLLREELDRSRATFVERFGEEVEVRHRIFTTTVLQQLCEGDPAKLGKAPWA